MLRAPSAGAHKVGALFSFEASPQRSQMLFAPLPPRSDALPNIQG